MFFETRPEWEDLDPILCSFDASDSPSSYWRSVEMQLSIFYYHVHIPPKANEQKGIGTNIICGDIRDALNFLSEFPGSTLSLQTPEWVNNGEPGLYRVKTLYKSADPTAQPYIATCINNKVFILDLDSESQRIDPDEIIKTIHWALTPCSLEKTSNNRAELNTTNI